MRTVWQPLPKENLAGKRESKKVTYPEAARERQSCSRGSSAGGKGIKTRCWENALGPAPAELFCFVPFAQTREQRAVAVQSPFTAPMKTKCVFIPCAAPQNDSQTWEFEGQVLNVPHTTGKTHKTYVCISK